MKRIALIFVGLFLISTFGTAEAAKDQKGASEQAYEHASDNSIFNRVGDWFATVGKSDEEKAQIKAERKAARAQKKAEKKAKKMKDEAEDAAGDMEKKAKKKAKKIKGDAEDSMGDMEQKTKKYKKEMKKSGDDWNKGSSMKKGSKKGS